MPRTNHEYVDTPLSSKRRLMEVAVEDLLGKKGDIEVDQDCARSAVIYTLLGFLKREGKGSSSCSRTTR